MTRSANNDPGNGAKVNAPEREKVNAQRASGRQGMPDALSAYQLALSVHRDHAVPAFPVQLFAEADDKWQKKPLVKWGSITRDTSPGEFNWSGANAVGVPMGQRSGLFAFDVDSYKEGCAYDGWAQKHELPPTRTHGTTSGGRHLIYRMPEGIDFGNRAPKVQGLDVRGTGGFIVWADTLGRYTVIDPQDPVAMPQSVIDELAALNAGMGSNVRDADLPQLSYVDEQAYLPKLQAMLSDPLRWRSLRLRFSGVTDGLKDRTRSSMDMSAAHLLAQAGFSYDEIVMILLRHFPHGKAERDGWTDAVERECCRCAWRAVSQRDENRQRNVEDMQQRSARLARLLSAKQHEGWEGRQ